MHLDKKSFLNFKKVLILIAGNSCYFKACSKHVWIHFEFILNLIFKATLKFSMPVLRVFFLHENMLRTLSKRKTCIALFNQTFWGGSIWLSREWNKKKEKYLIKVTLSKKIDTATSSQQFFRMFVCWCQQLLIWKIKCTVSFFTRGLDFEFCSFQFSFWNSMITWPILYLFVAVKAGWPNFLHRVSKFFVTLRLYWKMRSIKIPTFLFHEYLKI